ncbi:MAG: SdiA-regulated domain-containing protein [Bacteroidota bacterium]
MSKKSKNKLTTKALIKRAEEIAAGHTAGIDRINRTYINDNRSKKWPLAAALGILILAAGLFFGFRYRGSLSLKSKMSKKESAAADSGNMLNTADGSQITGITVVEKWEMPPELTEISANVFIDADRVACIQDNDAIIYLYNLRSKKVERNISFGAAGDYEGLAIVNTTYYVLRADGELFEVKLSASGEPMVKQYNLPLEIENDTEPMFYDKAKDRLLIGVKEKDPSGGPGKGIYSFDLKTKKMTLDPVFMLTGANNNSNAERSGKKKGKGSIKPSEIAISPKTGDIYVLNGPKSQFIIADPSGKIKTTIQLDEAIFPQPEGMCFSPSGELYISSEGKNNSKAIIARVAFEYGSEQ